jgi:hypothetical protein
MIRLQSSLDLELITGWAERYGVTDAWRLSCG